MATVELRNIVKRFGEVEALSNISITVSDGEMFCLLGPSGAGKSTTLGIISGIEKPDEGSVLIDGEDITTSFPQERDVAAAFESYALYPQLTVYRNLMYPLEAPIRKGKHTKEWRDERVRATANMLGIGELLHRYPRELSGGQRQRVSLGRTLVREPSIYLLDEPIAHLDAKLRHRMRSELKRIQSEMGISTLYATPDQLEALSMADRIAVLNKGVIEQIGDADSLYYEPKNTFVATFVGEPPMNLFAADLRDAGLVVFDGSSEPIPLGAFGGAAEREIKSLGNAILGIRPTDVRLTAPGDSDSLATGEVLLLDTLGQTTVVRVQIGERLVTARIETDMNPGLHERVGVAFNLERLYAFHAESRQAIR